MCGGLLPKRFKRSQGVCHPLGKLQVSPFNLLPDSLAKDSQRPIAIAVEDVRMESRIGQLASPLHLGAQSFQLDLGLFPARGQRLHDLFLRGFAQGLSLVVFRLVELGTKALGPGAVNESPFGESKRGGPERADPP